MVERAHNEQLDRAKWMRLGLLSALVLILLLIVFGNRFYNTIQAPYWAVLSQAEQKAVEQLDLREVTDVERFVGEEPVSIVYAVNSSGEPIVVWMWNDSIRVERQADGVSKEALKAAVLAEDSDKQLLRIQPGTLRDELVWEVFYKKQEDGGVRHYYDYYRFSDGRKLDTYRLALKM